MYPRTKVICKIESSIVFCLRNTYTYTKKVLKQKKLLYSVIEITKHQLYPALATKNTHFVVNTMIPLSLYTNFLFKFGYIVMML